MQKVSFEKENLLAEVQTTAKLLGKNASRPIEKKKPKHFKIITLILQSINVHTTKLSCKRWANDKMMY